MEVTRDNRTSTVIMSCHLPPASRIPLRLHGRREQLVALSKPHAFLDDMCDRERICQNW